MHIRKHDVLLKYYIMRNDVAVNHDIHVPTIPLPIPNPMLVVRVTLAVMTVVVVVLNFVAVTDNDRGRMVTTIS